MENISEIELKNKILEDRENRLILIGDKIKSTSNLILVLKANICGDYKNINEVNLILPIFLNIVVNTFKMVKYEKINSCDGNYFIIEIEDKDYIEVKRKLIQIEESFSGRIIDIDLYSNAHKSVTRGDLELPPRSCIVCNDLYFKCVRERKHTVNEVLAKTKEIAHEGFLQKIIKHTTNALINEVKAHPKFALVTEKEQGIHSDMDYKTFISSIEAIEPFLYEYAKEGFEFDEDTFLRLRNIGMKAEKEMFKATSGINTHKGAIFLLGILLPSITNVIYKGEDFSAIQSNVKFLSKDLLKDFENLDSKENLSYGEQIYLDLGIGGVRAFAFSGMDLVFDLVNDYEDCLYNINDKVINILLSSMCKLDDTVIIHKSNLETLTYIKYKSNKLLELIKGNDFDDKLVKDEVLNFNRICKVLKVSPGGSADIVILVLLLLDIKRVYFRK